MKKAVKCDECHMIIHKKCIARCQTSTTCSREPIIQLASSRESISSHLPEEHPRKLSRTSSSAFGKLRRRKNRNKSGGSSSLSLLLHDLNLFLFVKLSTILCTTKPVSYLQKLVNHQANQI